MAEAVKVAVRIRPFNGREKDRNSKCCIEMNGAQTTITDPDSGEAKDFAFDFSYWSHDGFHEDDTGALIGDTDKYATQRKVFDDLGQGVLKNAQQGFNCSLFAYGQTGAGKSFSMVGYGVNKGIVPITCDELFQLIERNAGGPVKYQVTFQMLEIYNEQVRDLLRTDNPKGGLQVRQNPKIGAFYVQDLKAVAVGSYKEIEARTEEGTANRTVAATAMNATSSRAHTLITIQFDQIEKNAAGEETKKESVINLIDLAGSERADSTGATGDRLKEGANINKSLSSLGNVISALADQSMGKKKVMVPYRDSTLTKLLQNALGGNSKTIMIAALSPADINHDETLGTLRYADRAKKIKNKAVVNENPMDKLIRELKEENEKLKAAMTGDMSAMLAASGGGDGGGGGGGKAMTPEEEAALRKQMEDEIRAQMEENMKSMQSNENWDQKLKESRSEVMEMDQAAQKTSTTPHIVNLNEDAMLSGVIRHFVDKESISIGSKKDGASPDVALSGLSIQKEHAVISMSGSDVTIKPGASGAKTKVNGVALTGERPLLHNDRILFGSNHSYFFVNPTNKTMSEGSPAVIDWDYAQKEIAEAKGFATQGLGLNREQAMAQEQVLELLPNVSEVNAISEELDKKKSFEVILISGAAQGGSDAGTKVVVKMKDLLNNNVWLWDRGKFTNRRFIMQELYQRHLDGDETVSKIPQDEDPFWEPPEDVLIGSANVFLQSLSYALDFDDKLTITDYKGSEEGSIVINITPCSQAGKPLDEDYFVEEPKDLIGKPYHFKVLIRHTEVNRSCYRHGIYVKYKSYGEETPTQTKTVHETLAPEFNESKVFSIPAIGEEHLDWFDAGCMTFYVYALQKDGNNDPKLTKMTTKELREMDANVQSGLGNRQMTIMQRKAPDSGKETSMLKADVIRLNRKIKNLEGTKTRVQDVVKAWDPEKKPPPEQNFLKFHTEMKAAAFHERGKMKFRVNQLNAYLKKEEAATGQPKSEIKVVAGSKACAIM